MKVSNQFQETQRTDNANAPPHAERAQLDKRRALVVVCEMEVIENTAAAGGGL